MLHSVSFYIITRHQQGKCSKTHFGSIWLNHHVLFKLLVVVGQTAKRDPFSKTLPLSSAIKADTWGTIFGAGLEAAATLFYCCGLSLKLNKPLLSFAEIISVKQGEAELMRWIWMDNNRNDMNSEPDWLNNETGLLTQEACGSTSERILLGYSFSFHSPKPWLFFWISPHQNCTQTSRHHSNPPGLWFAFEDSWEHVWTSPDQMQY